MKSSWHSKLRTQKLCSILSIKWEQYVTNGRVIEWAYSQSVESLTMKHCFWWSRHVIKMEESKFPHPILFSECTLGKDHEVALLGDTTIKSKLHWKPLELNLNCLKDKTETISSDCILPPSEPKLRSHQKRKGRDQIANVNGQQNNLYLLLCSWPFYTRIVLELSTPPP